MTLNDHATWVPEEWGGPVLTQVLALSAVEALGRHEPMGTNTKHVPRDGGIGLDILDKGDVYTEDGTEDDEVLLTSRKFGRALSLADEDVKDAESLVDVLNAKKVGWAGSFAKGFDNACLATVGAQGMAANRPFTSVYQTVRTADADLGYTANANYVSTAAVTYANLSEALGVYEDGSWFSDADTVVIASPAFKRIFRDILDENDHPIFLQGTAGTPDTLFGYTCFWSQGARTSTAATNAPTGNPLLIVGNQRLLIVGDRSGPESFVAGADSGVGFATDEAKLKCRARRGFAVGHPTGFAVLEQTAS
jgi:HK97 family phage major capsid protein